MYSCGGSVEDLTETRLWVLKGISQGVHLETMTHLQNKINRNCRYTTVPFLFGKKPCLVLETMTMQSALLLCRFFTSRIHCATIIVTLRLIWTFGKLDPPSSHLCHYTVGPSIHRAEVPNPQSAAWCWSIAWAELGRGEDFPAPPPAHALTPIQQKHTPSENEQNRRVQCLGAQNGNAADLVMVSFTCPSFPMHLELKSALFQRKSYSAGFGS